MPLVHVYGLANAHVLASSLIPKSWGPNRCIKKNISVNGPKLIFKPMHPLFVKYRLDMCRPNP